jgi:hypothetical protein
MDDGDTVSFNTQKYYVYNQEETGPGLHQDDQITIPYACVVGFEYLLAGTNVTQGELLNAALEVCYSVMWCLYFGTVCMGYIRCHNSPFLTRPPHPRCKVPHFHTPTLTVPPGQAGDRRVRGGPADGHPVREDRRPAPARQPEGVAGDQSAVYQRQFAGFLLGELVAVREWCAVFQCWWWWSWAMRACWLHVRLRSNGRVLISCPLMWFVGLFAVLSAR